MVGAAGVVGRAVAAELTHWGIPVRVDSKRGAKGLNVTVCSDPVSAVEGCPIVVGAGPTGATVPAQALHPNAIVVDVAIPGTIVGRPARGVQILAGEAMTLPSDWKRGGWGHLFHVVAGYGPRQVYACLVEPLILAAQGRMEPFAQGRRISPDGLEQFGQAAKALGFEPRLAGDGVEWKHAV